MNSTDFAKPVMNIQFGKTAEEGQKALRLRAILKQCSTSVTDDETRSVINTLLHQIESCLSDPGMSQFSSTAQETAENRTGYSSSLARMIASLWHSITGPSRREVELGKQRREQLERAEHAETSAFEALAETATLKLSLDQARRKIHELETALGRKPGS